MTTIDELRLADSSYKSFPSFEEWMKCSVDTNRWERYTALLNKRGELSPELLKRAREVAKRAAAIDTGAIEGLYEVDRGFTFTVATQAAMWEAALDSKGKVARSLIECQMKAYDYVIDFATRQVPIAEAWIRELHSEICSAQETYNVYTEVGPQTQPLPLGEYKHLPNHVRGRDGKIHSYAPVDLTSSEMHRLCQELLGTHFLSAHPVLQASYAHYALTVIHPFADGNGRVARALASVFTYRSNSIPLLVLAENRLDYYADLEAADTGDYPPFVGFVLDRALDAIVLVDESLRAAIAPEAEDSIAMLSALFVTKGGYTHADVDRAGQSLLKALIDEASRQATPLNIKGQLEIRVSQTTGSGGITNPGYRATAGGGRGLGIRLTSSAPATAAVSLSYWLLVPKDCGREDDLLIESPGGKDVFGARITEVIPRMSAALQMRMSIFVQRILREALAQLLQQARKQIGRKS